MEGHDASFQCNRRSWKENGLLNTTDFAFDNQLNVHIDVQEELNLTAFSGTPRLDFGQLTTNQSKSVFLKVNNPHDIDYDIVIEKFPFKKEFFVDTLEFTVPANDSMILEIKWLPEQPGNCREMVLFRVQDTFRLQAYLIGTAVLQPAKRTGLSAQKTVASLQPCNILRTSKKASKSVNVCQTDKNVPSNLCSDKTKFKRPLALSNTSYGAMYKINRAVLEEKTTQENIANVKDVFNTGCSVTYKIHRVMSDEKIVPENKKNILNAPSDNFDQDLFRKPLEPMNLMLLKNDPRLPESPIRRITYTKFSHNILNHCENEVTEAKQNYDPGKTSAFNANYIHFVETAHQKLHKRNVIRYIETNETGTKCKSEASKDIAISKALVSNDKNSAFQLRVDMLTNKNCEPSCDYDHYEMETEDKENVCTPNSKTQRQKWKAQQNEKTNRIVLNEMPIEDELEFSDDSIADEIIPARGSLSDTNCVSNSDLPTKEDFAKETNEVASVDQQTATPFVTAPGSPLMSGSDYEDSVCFFPNTEEILIKSASKLTKDLLNEKSVHKNMKSLSPPIASCSYDENALESDCKMHYQNAATINYIPPVKHMEFPVNSREAGELGCKLIDVVEDALFSRSNSSRVSQLGSPSRLNESPLTKYFSENFEEQRLGCRVDLGDIFGNMDGAVNTKVYHRLSSTPLPKDLSHDSSGSVFLDRNVASPIIGSRVSNETIVKSKGDNDLCIPVLVEEHCNDANERDQLDYELVSAQDNNYKCELQVKPIEKEIFHQRLVEINDKQTCSSSFNTTSFCHNKVEQADCKLAVHVNRLRSEHLPTKLIVNDTTVNIHEISSNTASEIFAPRQAAFGQTVTKAKVTPVMRNSNCLPLDSKVKCWGNTEQALREKLPLASLTKGVNKRKHVDENTDNGVEERRAVTNLKKRPDHPTVNRALRTCSSTVGVSRLHSVVSGSVKKKSSPHVAQRRLILFKPTIAMPRHPLPSAAKNVFYDECWMEKEERAFSKWLNFILTPPDDYFSVEKSSNEVANVLLAEHNNATNVGAAKLAPSRETLSLRTYSAKRKLNELRKTACRLFQSEEILFIIRRLERAIECGHLIIRKDKALHADLGMKKLVLDLLLCYNVQWLRLGLEVIYGELLIVNDVAGVSNFIMSRLLACPDIAYKYAHPTVPHLYSEGFAEAMAAFTLKKFLLLILFLDKAKEAHIIDYDPCLFCKTAKIKSSRDVLLSFSRDLLTGEGDITRHLAYYGYFVKHVQTYLDEFNYAVTNIAVDLRDGIRLCRIIELMIHEWDLCKSLRVPASSRLQKIHNVQVALNALVSRGVTLATLKDKPIDAKCIVDGNRGHTLLLLWQIIFKFQIEKLLNTEVLEREVKLLKSCRRLKKVATDVYNSDDSKGDLRIARDSTMPTAHFESILLVLLKEWCQLVCSFYDVQVENLTVSFSDGRALCTLLHHYQPLLLPLKDIHNQTTLTLSQDMCKSPGNNCSSPSEWTTPEVNYKELLLHETQNFKLFNDKLNELGGVPLLLRSSDMSNTIPDEKVVVTFLAYLCSRLLNLSTEMRAARNIQLAWQCYKLKKNKIFLQKQVVAAKTIQRTIRTFLVRKQWIRKCQAVIYLQRAWRRILAHRKQRLLQEAIDRQQKEIAATKLQACVRGFFERKRQKTKLDATVTLQSWWRMLVKMRKYKLLLKYSLALQQRFRTRKISRLQRSQYLDMKATVIYLQSFCRTFLTQARETQHKEAAARIIQYRYRTYMLRKEYTRKRNATIIIQSAIRKFLCVNKFVKLRQAVVTLQRNWRAKLARKRFIKTRCAAVCIQSIFRGWRCRSIMKQEHKAATVLQSFYKARVQQIKYKQLKYAALIIQAKWRGIMARKVLKRKSQLALTLQAIWRGYCVRKRMHQLTKAVISVQRKWKSLQIHRDFKQKKAAVIVLQRCWRRNIIKKRQNAAAVVLQKQWKGFQAKQAFLKQKAAALVLQNRWRTILIRRNFLKQKAAATTLQNRWKMIKTRKNFLRVKAAAQILQNKWKTIQIRKHFLTQKAAAVVIQNRWKTIQMRRNFLRQKTAAVVIQNKWKTIQIRRNFLRQKAAAIIIQSRWRKIQAHRSFLIRKSAAIVLQARWRGRHERRQFILLKCATILVQAAWRRRQERLNFLKEKRAAIIVQSRWRTKTLRRQFLKCRNAAVELQSAYRGWQIRKEVLKRKVALTKIQASWKGLIVRRKFMQCKMAVVTLQSHWRGFCAREQYLKQRRAAIAIQTRWRGYWKKLQFSKIKNAAITVQSRWKSYQERKKFLRLKAAAIIIQSRWRERVVVKEKTLRKKAAIIIQSRWRGNFARCQFQQVRTAAIKIQAWWKTVFAVKKYQQVKRAAILLQSRWRGNRTLKSYKKIKNAAVTLQSKWRSVAMRKKFISKRSSAISIQSVYRSYSARKRFLQLKAAAVSIQSNWKCLLERRRYLALKATAVLLQAAWKAKMARKQFLSKKIAAVTLQSQWRSRAMRRSYLKLKAAAIIVQNRWRMKIANNKFVSLKAAAVKIQSLWRGVLVRRHFAKVVKAACKIQAVWRMRVAQQAFVNKRSAAIKLQSQWRATRTRRQFLQFKAAALIIQTKWRSHLAIKRYCASKTAITNIQSCWRSFVLRRKYVQLRSAAVTLQANWRRHRAQQKFIQAKVSAIAVQSAWRGLLARRDLAYKKKCVVRIQSKWRGVRQQKKFNRLKQATIVLQSTWRAFRAQHQYLETKSKTIVIQNWWRSICARREYNSLKSAAIMIQSKWKARQARKDFLALKTASVCIQKCWRAKLAKKSFTQKKMAIITIQTWWRNIIAKRQSDRLSSVVLYVQSKWRMLRARKDFLQLKRAAITIQKHKKGQIQRKQMKLVKAAIVKIQSQWRGVIAQKKFTQMKSAAIVIQRLWRGRLVRKEYLLTKAAVIVLQSRWRQKMLCRKLNEAATCLQATFKMVAIRRQYQALKSATVTVQRLWRQNKIWKQEQLEIFHKRTIAATCLQSNWRAFKCRQLYCLARSSAVKIQQMWRSLAQKRKFQHTLMAFRCLQRMGKAIVYELQFTTTVKACVLIQTYWRAKQSRQSFIKLKQSAIVIQSGWKAKQARQNFLKLRKSISVIQAYWQGYMLRRDYLKLRSAAICIQRDWKRKQARLTFLKLKAAALILQHLWRERKKKQDSRKNVTFVISSDIMTSDQSECGAYYKENNASSRSQNGSRAVNEKLKQLVHDRDKIYDSRPVSHSACDNKDGWWRGRSFTELISDGEINAKAEMLRDFLSSTVRYSDAIHASVCEISPINSLHEAFHDVNVSANDQCPREQFTLSACVQDIHVVPFVEKAKLCDDENKASDVCTRTDLLLLKQQISSYENESLLQELKENKSSCQLLHVNAKRCIDCVKSENIVCSVVTDNCCLLPAVYSKSKNVIESDETVQKYHDSTNEHKLASTVLLLKAEVMGSAVPTCKNSLYTEVSKSAVHSNVIPPLVEVKELVLCSEIAVQNVAPSCKGIEVSAKQTNLIPSYTDLYPSCTNITSSCTDNTPSCTDISPSCTATVKSTITPFCDIVESAMQLSTEIVGAAGLERLTVVSSSLNATQSNDHCIEFSNTMAANKNATDVIEPACCDVDFKQVTNKNATVVLEQACCDVDLNQITNKNATVVLEQACCDVDLNQITNKNATVVLDQACHDVDFNQITNKNATVVLEQTCCDVAFNQIMNKNATVVLDQACCDVALNQMALQDKNSAGIENSCRRKTKSTPRKIFTMEMKIKSANIIQAFWRGTRERIKINDRRISLARARIEAANQKITVENKLCNRVAFALDELLTYKQFSAVLKAMMDLEKTTSLLPQCCEQMIESPGAIAAVYKLINSCNRSIPHMELILYCIRVLLNLAKFHKTMPAVYSTNGMETLIHLLQMYRDKKSPIFIETCMLLSLLLQDPHIRMEVNKQSTWVNRLLSLYKIICKKHKMDSDRLVTKSKQAFTKNLAANLQPHWSLQCIKKTIDEPLEAIVFVIESMYQ